MQEFGGVDGLGEAMVRCLIYGDWAAPPAERKQTHLPHSSSGTRVLTRLGPRSATLTLPRPSSNVPVCYETQTGSWRR